MRQYQFRVINNNQDRPCDAFTVIKYRRYKYIVGLFNRGLDNDIGLVAGTQCANDALLNILKIIWQIECLHRLAEGACIQMKAPVCRFVSTIKTAIGIEYQNRKIQCVIDTFQFGVYCCKI